MSSRRYRGFRDLGRWQDRAGDDVGTDKKTDLALLKLKQGGTYQFVEFAKSTPRVGEWVIAVGNPFGLGAR